MSFGLGISFGRLCRLEELRKELEPPKPTYETEDWLFWERDGGVEAVYKGCLEKFGRAA